MNSYAVAEKFVSINGEGKHAGELAVFLRFRGCNLACGFCDTKWANTAAAPAVRMTTDELVAYVRETGVRKATLTGGEPLLQPGIDELITALGALGYRVEIETNGSGSLQPFAAQSVRPCFTMDYKLPGSGMEQTMLPENFSLLRSRDAVKFVAGSRADLERALEIIRKYGLIDRCTVFFSPVFGSIEPAEIVEFLKEHTLNGVRLQLQLHKFIWDPLQRGV